ncbi:hypothetical protein SAMN05444266_108315 [Chitinophaga jiangningensis]|uniref:PsbP protein n=1 Tax=Chitinophaga jiangningensis TaxID=1419482 RepID=A0A1M7JEA2_9BACT|nr:hypothetical protein [Chitinophaga jiangningensis]SHM50827.1 hypothetical protein SAMN05444266_108315 [Chitinophaga jiangningensis]
MKIIIPLCLLLTLLACNNKSVYRKAADEIVEQIPANHHLNVGNRRYNIYVPAGWTTNTRTEYGIDYYFLLAPKTAADPNTNINVITEDMQHYTLEEYMQKTIQAVMKAIPSAVILDQGLIETDSLKGAWYKYNMEPRGIKATLVSYVFPKDNIAYIITAGTQTKDAGRYRPLFDSVATSFRFIN